MREKVCIVLNEREPAKRKAAETLEARLLEHNITVSRPSIDKNIEKIIIEKLPDILILDYLIGDYTTGLDILQSINSVIEDKRPITIFLTDEPGVPVAVDAMKLGAVDYIEIDNPQSVQNTVRQVLSMVSDDSQAHRYYLEPDLRLDELVAQSDPSRILIDSARTASFRPSPITVVTGRDGSGLTTIAKAIHHERECSGLCRTVDLYTYDGSYQELFGLSVRRSKGYVLGKNLSLIIDHAEEDTGELLDLLNDKYKQIWPASSSGVESFLTICTSSPETAAAWHKLLPVEVIPIPSLEERSDDIPALVQKFIGEAEKLANLKIKAFDTEILNWMAGQYWIHEIRQLKSTVIDTAIRSIWSKKPVLELIQEHRALYDLAENQASSLLIDSHTAASVLELANHNYRVASAKIGCSVNKLKEIINNSEEH